MTNVQQNFMDTQIVKVSLLFGYVISYNSMNEIFFKLVNVIMKDQRTKHVTMKEGVIVLLTCPEINVLHAVKVTTHAHNV